MKLAIVTAYPPSKVTLNEYAYHLVKQFRQKETVTELILLTDKTEGSKDLEFTEAGCKITVKECWEFNSYTNVFNIYNAINDEKPDAVLFNLQFMKFGDKKIPAALAKKVSESINIPTIGIGGGADTDGQVLVTHDLLGITKDFHPRFLRRYLELFDLIKDSVEQYIKDVKSGDFPNKNEQY